MAGGQGTFLSATFTQDVPDTFTRVTISGSDVAKLARATDGEEINDIVAAGIARYMNGGMYTGFSPDDFKFNLDDVTFRGVETTVAERHS
ncbi:MULTISPECIES: hypothetical protein [Streptomyces]|uniref:Uncharacterized protein n=1 Tax=Streptomyces triticiradicis TaxID=2651189 RepID=A0A7J5DFR5_9ACTN|nr:hypothetical protein [Streptomyces triticiradicis]KAB1987437.1 hypothetical protein F8144_17045 [Streptomyces triticiradicis]